MQYSQYRGGAQPPSNITLVQPPGYPAAISPREQSGLIGGELVSSLTQAQFAMAQSQSANLTLSKFPVSTVTPVPQPLIPLRLDPSNIADSNILVTQTKRLLPVDNQVIQQLQAPGQPFVGALPEPETKVLLQTMDHYGSYNIFSFLDVHYPESHCTLIPKKLYNRYLW